jgi:hypothetical protein
MSVESVKIGCAVFSVGFVDDLHDDGHKLDGWIRYHDSQILIDSDCKAQRAKQVLWHEILHGICDCVAIDQPNEEALTAMANLLVDVLMCNPELVKLTVSDKPVVVVEKGNK